MLFIIIICAVSIDFISGHEVPYSTCRKCDTKECLDEGKYLLSFMNLSANPCDNFYEYACGNFIKNGIIEPASYINNILTRSENEIYQEITRQLQQDVQSTDTASTAKIKTFFHNCMNETYSEKDETAILKDLLTSLGGWPIAVGPEWNENEFSLDNSLQLLVDRRYISFFPFELTIYERENSRDALCISRLETYFDNEDLTMDLRDSLSKSYYDYILTSGILLGAQNPLHNSTYLMNEILDIMEFEKNFVTKFNITGCTIDSSIMTIKSLSDELPSTPWLTIFNTILNPTNITVDENDLVAIENWDYISNLSELLTTTSWRKIANYLGWNIIKSSVKYTQGYLAKVRQRFVNLFYNRSVSPTRAEICLEGVLENFEFGVGAMYAKRHVEEVDAINKIFTNVRIQMKKEIEKLKWMNRDTKDIIQEKVDAISFDFGSIIEKWNDETVDEYYNDLEVYPGSYYSSQLNTTLYMLVSQFDKHWKKLHDRDFNSIFYYGASYQRPVPNVSGYNRIVLSPAYLSRSKYNRNRPSYLNYAGIGVTFGHEIAHAFDRYNINFDKTGQRYDWTDKNTELEFAMQHGCLNTKYFKYHIQGNLSINGRKTFKENFADHAGYKAAYLAYKEQRSQGKELCLEIPGLEHYTWQQMYWINVAINKCTKYSPGVLETVINEDKHSPDEARVNIPLMNSEDFARDFNCKVNSSMNPKKKCKII